MCVIVGMSSHASAQSGNAAPTPTNECAAPQESSAIQLANARSAGDAVRVMSDGNTIPLLALGVYQTEPGAEAYEACKAALKAGYRHIDSAALYRKERAVGRAVRDSGLPREAV